jgi:O-antigen/teichoic acid export membrane protein
MSFSEPSANEVQVRELEELKVPIERISRNTIFNYLGQFWYKALNLVLLPVVVSGLGNDSYGLYTLVAVVIGYYALLDLGINSAIVKYVSEHNAKGEREEINRVVSTSLQAYLLLGIIGCLLIVFLSRFILAGVKMPLDLHRTARIVLAISAFQFLVNITGSVFAGVLNGLQRIDVLNKVSIVFNTLMVVSMAILAKLGYGLIPIVSLNFVFNIGIIAANAYFASRAMPGLTINLRLIYPAKFRKILSYGTWTFIIQAGTLIHLTTDRFLIGLFLPISFVTYYVVAVKLADVIRAVPMPVVGVLFPAVADLKAKGEKRAIREIFLRGTKYVLMLSIPVSVVLFIFSREILKAWMGPQFADESSVVLMLTAAGYFLNTLTFVNTSVLFGLGAHRLMAIYSIFSSILNFVLALILIPRMGINGAALASFVAFLLTNPVLVVHSMRVFNVKLDDLLKTLRQTLVAGALMVILTFWVLKKVHPAGWLSLIICAVFLVLFYYAVLAIARGFDERDRYVLRKLVEAGLKSTPLKFLTEHREMP